MERVGAAILGSGNIGTDLLYKLKRSPWLTPTVMAGIIPESEGLARARAEGLVTTHDGIEGLLKHRGLFDIVFEATTAKAHLDHAPLLESAGKIAIDLTPAAVGPYVVPLVNLHEHVGASNLNLISCGGQATVPIVAALRSAASIEYAEIVATIASRSAGPGTRQNIDEFTQTTARGLERIGGARRGKAIIVLNPGDPPILMRNAVHAILEEADPDAIRKSVEEMVERVRVYVPGYRLKSQPLVQGRQVTVFLEVEGTGDYLPRFAGNLDIMTAAAVKVGEEVAQHLLDAARDRDRTVKG